MDSSIRTELHQAISELTELYPEWRYGQLICNIASWARDNAASAVWDIEDAELLDAVKSRVAKVKETFNS